MRRAIAYGRVSTQQQGENGVGLNAQRAAIKEFAAATGFNVMKTFEDVHTGMGARSVLDRPEFQEALKLARAKGWPILVSGIDRAGRDRETLEKLIEEGLLISAEDAAGADIPSLKAKAAKAQVIGERISETTTAALDIRKQQGQKLGNLKTLRTAQLNGAAANRQRSEKRVLELEPIVSKLRKHGHTSATDIADALNQKEIPTSRGGRWNKDNIRRLLKGVDVIVAERAQTAQHKHENPNWGTW